MTASASRCLGVLLLIAATNPAHAADDPRPGLVEIHLGKPSEVALAATQAAIEEGPDEANLRGLAYLRGRLFERLGRLEEAREAFAETMGQTPTLALYGRYRMALVEEKANHPEVAAGLVASVIGQNAPQSLLVAANQLLTRTIEKGGDCRLVRQLSSNGLPSTEVRRLAYTKAYCALRTGDTEAGREAFRRLLLVDKGDEPARMSANRLAGQRPTPGRPWSEDPDLLVGMTFFQHREFIRAIHHLEAALARLPARRTLDNDLEVEIRYALARSNFWLERFDHAASLYEDLALRARNLGERARMLYQQARSLELANHWTQADAAFRRTYSTAPQGRWADAALLSAMRLEWKSGKEREALELYSILRKGVGWGELTARAALFLAASDLVRGRTDRAEAFLSDAGRLSKLYRVDVDYWRGRLAELQGQPRAASDRYLSALLRSPYHPLALAARQRLHAEPLRDSTRRSVVALAANGRSEDLYAALLILGEEVEAAQPIRRRLENLPGRDGTPRLPTLSRIPAARWNLWRQASQGPEDMLLSLGFFDEGASVVPRHFPISNPNLAYTASVELARAGKVRESLVLADALRARIAGHVETPLIPSDLRSLLFPMPWSETIRGQSDRFDIDPFLLAAVIREESAFDPNALSDASARGLTQFVWLTAKRLSSEIQLSPIRPEDLYRPEISIPLGAAYLRELQNSFAGSEMSAVAAYNAGEAQSSLWRAYCFSEEPEELYTKVGFTQTRNYLRKVLSSREQYRLLYGGKSDASVRQTTGGKDLVSPSGK